MSHASRLRAFSSSVRVREKVKNASRPRTRSFLFGKNEASNGMQCCICIYHAKLDTCKRGSKFTFALQVCEKPRIEGVIDAWIASVCKKRGDAKGSRVEPTGPEPSRTAPTRVEPSRADPFRVASSRPDRSRTMSKQPDPIISNSRTLSNVQSHTCTYIQRIYTEYTNRRRVERR